MECLDEDNDNAGGCEKRGKQACNMDGDNCVLKGGKCTYDDTTCAKQLRPACDEQWDTCAWSADKEKCVIDMQCSQKGRGKCQGGNDECAWVKVMPSPTTTMEFTPGTCMRDTCATSNNNNDECKHAGTCVWHKGTQQCINKNEVNVRKM